MENVTARAKPAPRVNHWPRSRLICIQQGLGLPEPPAHWRRSLSLSLHKTHMELHVQRLYSSMKPLRARVPPRPPEWSLPLPVSTLSIHFARLRPARRARSGTYHCGAGELGPGQAFLEFLELHRSPNPGDLPLWVTGLRLAPGTAGSLKRTCFVHSKVSFNNWHSHSFISRLWTAGTIRAT